MKYCLKFNSRSKYIDEIDEIIFECDSQHHYKDILLFLAKHKEKYNNKKIILHLKQNSDIINVAELIKRFELGNITLLINDYYELKESEYAFLKEGNIPFFFFTRVNNWETFLGLLNTGVSDMYITEDLGFQLDKIGPLAHAKSISLRTFANVCQTVWKESDGLRSFFIRPEDVDSYGEYIDVIEFFAESEDQYDTFYKIYAKDKKWFGDLREIIIGLKTPLYSPSLFKFFGASRATCNRKCFKGRPCAVCERSQEASETFFRNGVFIKS